MLKLAQVEARTLAPHACNIDRADVPRSGGLSTAIAGGSHNDSTQRKGRRRRRGRDLAQFDTKEACLCDGRHREEDVHGI